MINDIPDTPPEVDGWEYLLFADTLEAGRAYLESKWLDFDIGIARPSGEIVSDSVEVIQRMLDRTQELSLLVSNLNRIADPQNWEAAFGPPGISGDPDRIRHLANQLVGLYEAMIDWAASVRGTIVSKEAEDYRWATSCLVVGAVRQMRDSMDRSINSIRGAIIGARPEDGGRAIKIDLNFVLSIDEDDSQRFHDAYERVATSLEDGGTGIGGEADDLLAQVASELGRPGVDRPLPGVVGELGP